MEIFLWIFLVFLLVVWAGVVFIGPPFIPTLRKDLEVLFDELNLSKKDHFVDLGAGDGRVLMLAGRGGATVSGVEINPFLVLVAKWRLRKLKGTVRLGDMWKYKMPSDVTHVFMFGAGVFMNKLEQYLVKNIPNDRKVMVVCYGFSLPGKDVTKQIGAFNIYEF